MATPAPPAPTDHGGVRRRTPLTHDHRHQRATVRPTAAAVRPRASARLEHRLASAANIAIAAAVTRRGPHRVAPSTRAPALVDGGHLDRIP
jgi:hypothetical protein